MLKVREDHVSSVLDDARKRLGEVTKNEAEYKNVLSKLIVQGLYQVMEPKVTLRCRQVDVPLVQAVFQQSIDQYKSQMNQDVELFIDEHEFLAADTCGGVELLALNGRIKVWREYILFLLWFLYLFENIYCKQVPNTLESRLELISQQLVPEIRNALFGRNVNRKFTD